MKTFSDGKRDKSIGICSTDYSGTPCVHSGVRYDKAPQQIGLACSAAARSDRTNAGVRNPQSNESPHEYPKNTKEEMKQ